VHAFKHGMLLIGTAVFAAGCDDTATEPDSIESPAALPEFAAAINQWTTRADMPSTERLGLATATVINSAGQQVIYAVGGTTMTGGSLSKVMAYNAATNTWSHKAPLPIPLYWTNGIGVIGGKLYISGGLSGHKEYQPTLFVYDPARNTWTRKRDMPNTTFRGVTGVINGKMYVVTGCDQEDCFEFEPVAFYRYNPATDQWVRLPKPRSAHNWGMGGVINGKFYVTGSTTLLEVYDPATNRWTQKAPMPVRRWLSASAIAGGKLYVFGGYRENADGSITFGTKATSIYNPATDSWANKRPMPSDKSDVAASTAVVNGQTRIHVIGGRRPGNNIAYLP
jgi:N-acetylneuraminic acid mutarotase